jgi:hypothetical protein
MTVGNIILADNESLQKISNFPPCRNNEAVASGAHTEIWFINHRDTILQRHGSD